MQSTTNILLVRPANFSFNRETESSNAFQTAVKETNEALNQNALNEFEGTVNTLRENSINVYVFDDTKFPDKPDAVFPNNWVTFHPTGNVILYPMYAPNGQLERKARHH